MAIEKMLLFFPLIQEVIFVIRESKATDLYFLFVLCQLTMPSPMPEYLNVHYICETASRLLFLSMHWARYIPSFQALG